MSGTDSKRERILAAALDIFSTQGFANATVQEIAGRAKVGKGTVYTYFPAKEDILTYLLDEGLAHMGQHIGNRIRTVKGSATKLQAILREQLRYFHEHQSLCRLLAREAWGHDYASDSLAQRIRSSYIGMLQEVIEKGIKEGELRALDSETVATALYGMTSIVALYAKDLSCEKALERIEMTLQELFFGGITLSPATMQEA
ncbi:MAG: TetR/AcrR family transcriptional regulator [Firmicutes bacterium]|mgnify:CR=1 FL=1|nr:TetR/AcrR family transcriptional regulator [Bacillota bacterium]